MQQARIDRELGVRNAMADDITLLLNSARAGNKEAESHLISVVYAELRHMAARAFQKERPGHSMQATALVHEAYLKLFKPGGRTWKDRAHFFAVASQVMRHILIDHARASLASKRGGDAVPLPLDDTIIISKDRLEELLVLEDALTALERHDSRVSRVVTMRFYGGMDVDEIAQALQVSSRTVKRDWNYGRAWLKAGLSRKAGRGSG